MTRSEVLLRQKTFANNFCVIHSVSCRVIHQKQASKQASRIFLGLGHHKRHVPSDCCSGTGNANVSPRGTKEPQWTGKRTLRLARTYPAAPHASPCASDSASQPRQLIYGGEQTAVGKYPYYTEVTPDRFNVCGGTLVAPDMVLSHPQCL